MSGGTFNVSRTIWTHPAFAEEPFSEREAFMWMVGEASWKSREVRVGKIVALTERGQLAASVRFMAEAWKWSKSRVSRFLKRLENRDTIRTETGTGILVITICDYDDFQTKPADSGTEAGHLAGQKRDRSGTNEKQDKKDKKEKEKREPPIPPKGGEAGLADLFDAFWAAYPKRVERKGAERKFRAAVKSGVDPGRIVDAAQRYAESEQVRRGYAKNPTTWLNNGCWDDEQQQPTKGKTDDFASLMAFADRFDQRREAERQVDSGEGSGPSRPLLPGGNRPGSSSADARGLDRGPGRPAARGHRDSDDGMAPVVWFTAKAR